MKEERSAKEDEKDKHARNTPASEQTGSDEKLREETARLSEKINPITAKLMKE